MKRFLLLNYFLSSLALVFLCRKIDAFPVIATSVRSGVLATEQSKFVKHVVGIQVGTSFENYTCSGTIVDEHYILTAAHCFENIPKMAGVVFDLDLNTQNEDKVLYSNRVFIHPSYNALANDSSTWGNDLALIQLKSPLPEGYEPVDLDSSSYRYASKIPVTIAGYGNSYDGLEDILHFAELKANMYEGPESGRIFASPSLGHNACSGDSGGPVLFGVKQTLIGVIRSSTCDEGLNTYAIFTKVTEGKIESMIHMFEERLKADMPL